MQDRLYAGQSLSVNGSITSANGRSRPVLQEDGKLVTLAPHGRSWRMIREEWPRIRQDIDNNRLCPLALVQAKSLDPMQLGENHVVLVYGYELDGTDLLLKVYDPNVPYNPASMETNPAADQVTISLSVADANRTTPVFRSHGSSPIHCFFRLQYSRQFPTSFFLMAAWYGSSPRRT